MSRIADGPLDHVTDDQIRKDHARGQSFRRMADAYGIPLEELAAQLRRLMLLGSDSGTPMFRPAPPPPVEDEDDEDTEGESDDAEGDEDEPEEEVEDLVEAIVPRVLPSERSFVQMERYVPSDEIIRADRQSGMTHREMSLKYGVSQPAVTKHLKRLGLTSNTLGRPAGTRSVPAGQPLATSRVVVVPVAAPPPPVVEVVIPEPEPAPIPEVIPMPVAVPPAEPIRIPEGPAAPQRPVMEPDLAQLVMIAKLMREADVAADTAVSIMIAARAL